MTDDDAVAAVRNLLNHGDTLPAWDLVARIREVVGISIHSGGAVDAKAVVDMTERKQPLTIFGARYVHESETLVGEPAAPANCALCLNMKGERVTAPFVIDGYSLCDEHQDEVIAAREGKESVLFFSMDNRLDVIATILAHRKAKQVTST